MPKLLKAAMVDEKRRITLPRGYPPGCAVTIQRLDADSVLIQRRHGRRAKLVSVPIIAHLTDDPAQEKLEAAIARNLADRLPEPEE